MDIAVNPDAMFDIQIKRIHEYKRQLMNILETIALYNAMKSDPKAKWQPRVKIFAGKAAPSYFLAKLIIKLINDVADVVNNDAKFALNGALTVGTLDGANVEMQEHLGEENIFIFGMKADEVAERQHRRARPSEILKDSPRLQQIIHQLETGFFSEGDTGRYHDILENIKHHDYFQVVPDFEDYWNIQRHIDEVYQKPQDWAKMAILNTARMGWFSSDRTIRGYAKDIWNAPTA